MAAVAHYDTGATRSIRERDDRGRRLSDLAVLLVTGTANLFLKAGGSFAAIAAWWHTTYGLLLAAKLALVAVVFALSLYHDFVVGPAASRAMQVDQFGAAAFALRRRAALLGRANAVLSLVIMTLTLLLVRGLPT